MRTGVMALALYLQIERENQGRAVGSLGPIDQALDELPVLHHVELKPERFFSTPVKLAGMSAAPVRPNRRPGHGGSGCAGSERGVCGRGGGATPSRRPG